MKPTLTVAALVAALATTASASLISVEPGGPVMDTGGFATARRPISNPTLFDLALPTTNVHPIFLHHNLPERVAVPGGTVPMGGNVQVYALQFEIGRASCRERV